jgi:hypothetical protein
MPSVTAIIPATPERCWRTFLDPTLLAAWVPGLKRVRVVRRQDEDGLPLEIGFEFGDTLTYTLVYTYDAAARTARWSPRIGKRDAVEGSVRFAEHKDGCEMTYTLEAAPQVRERSDADVDRTVAAFVAFVTKRR